MSTSAPDPQAPGPEARDRVIEQWFAELADALGITDPGASPAEILDLAAVAAHAVIRPAAPLSTFLVGYAAGLAGGGADAVRTATERTRALTKERT